IERRRLLLRSLQSLKPSGVDDQPCLGCKALRGSENIDRTDRAHEHRGKHEDGKLSTHKTNEGLQSLYWRTELGPDPSLPRNSFVCLQHHLISPNDQYALRYAFLENKVMKMIFRSNRNDQLSM